MGADLGVVPDMLEVQLETPAEPVEPPQEPVEPAEPTEPSEPAEPSEPEPQHEEPSEVKEPTKEVLPAELSKAIRELKQAHPEQAPALKQLSDSFYRSRAYQEVYKTPEEARVAKAEMEAIGGADGIARLRQDSQTIEQLDQHFQKGNPAVIDTLAEDFPDGFKRLVPVALQRLAKVDMDSYRETMRGPLLQMMKGDGLIDEIAVAMQELKGGDTNRALRSLNKIAVWYDELNKIEDTARSRTEDPRVKELESREQALRTEQNEMRASNVRRDLIAYVNETLKPSVSTVLKGKTLSDAGRKRFEQNVSAEIVNRLKAHPTYGRSLNDLINQGKTDQAVNFAKPFIDAARRAAVTTVYTEMYGAAPAPAKPAPVGKPAEPRPAASVMNSQMVPIARKPEHDAIDWNKTKDLDFVTGHAYLKSGKHVTWVRKA